MAASKKGKRSKSAARKPRASSARADKSVEAFRDAVERTVTLPLERLQELLDDAVKRGRITRSDANELASNMVTRGRTYTDDLVKDLEKLLEQARKEVDSRVSPARRRAERTLTKAQRRTRDAAEPVLAEADRLRRRAGVGATPITGYDALSAAQVKTRLKGMKPAELRKVRTQEKRGKARKGILDAIEKQLAKR